jgi:hypothetical protein
MSTHLIGFIGAVLIEAVVVSLMLPRMLPIELGIAAVVIGAALVALAATMLGGELRAADLAMAGEKPRRLARQRRRARRIRR